METHSFCTGKLGEIMVFYRVVLFARNQCSNANSGLNMFEADY